MLQMRRGEAFGMRSNDQARVDGWESMSDAAASTPKRKRMPATAPDTPEEFSFRLCNPPAEDGSASPRTRVAHRFQGLSLDGTGPVGMSGATLHEADDEDSARKKKKKLDPDMTRDADIGKMVQTHERDTGVRADPEHMTTAEALAPVVAEDETQSTRGLKTTPRVQPRGRSPGTPPRAKTKATVTATVTASASASGFPEEHTVVDPIRATLTWQEDEITVYDPEDSDDDGTGINGIGFKPTAAIAAARTSKRRQQLAEYKKQEEREARARRNQRRKGSPSPGLVELKSTVERRRVRFLESATELIGT